MSSLKAKKRKREHISWGCIWCGGKPRSEEHLWPTWYSKIVPKEQNSFINMRVGIHYTPSTAVVTPTLLKRPGDAASMTIKAVCKLCNNGWMSAIESAVIPIMTPLFLGKDTCISPQEQARIVEWIALKTIIGEYDDRDNRAISDSIQRAFYNNRDLSGVWKIWIGKYNGLLWKNRYHYEPMQIMKRSELVGDFVQFSGLNTQSTTLIGGKLFIQVITSSTNAVEPFNFHGSTATLLRQLWPPVGRHIYWELVPAMGDEDVQIISSALSRWGTVQTGRPHPPSFST